MFEPGCKLLTMFHQRARPPPGGAGWIYGNRSGSENRRIRADPLAWCNMAVRKSTSTSHDEKCFIPLSALNNIQRPDFAIVGYGLSTKGFRDPTEFLLQSLDKFPRAAFEEVPTQKARRR